jgi:prepilin peptidase CpaA
MTILALVSPAAMCIFAFTMVHAGVTDLTTYKIRNGLVLLLLLAYAALAPFAGFAGYEIGWSVAVAAGVLLFAFALFALGWIGGGDGKLAAATALWFGADHAPAYLMFTALFGGALTLSLLQFRRMTLPALLRGSPWIAKLHSGGSGVPMGVAMAAAGLVVFPQTRWMSVIF